MRILQLANTPLAGFPYRLSRAIQQHTEHESRCIVGLPGYGTRTFPYDVLWSHKSPEGRQLLEWANTYVLHSYFSLKRNPWQLIKYMDPPKRVTAHYCIRPETANHELVELGVPTTVSAQYHARFFTRSTVMPNIMPIREGGYQPRDRSWPPDGPMRIAFSPSNRYGKAQQSKDPWSVKGWAETKQVLELVQQDNPGRVEFDIIEQVSVEECLRRRSICHVSIDEVMSGSYHNVFLEGMSQGLVSVAYMDPETLAAMGKVTGPAALENPPWVNVKLEGLRNELNALVQAPDQLRLRADRCRAWMEQYWDDRVLARLYTDFWSALPPYPA